MCRQACGFVAVTAGPPLVDSSKAFNDPLGKVQSFREVWDSRLRSCWLVRWRGERTCWRSRDSDTPVDANVCSSDGPYSWRWRDTRTWSRSCAFKRGRGWVPGRSCEAFRVMTTPHEVVRGVGHTTMGTHSQG